MSNPAASAPQGRSTAYLVAKAATVIGICLSLYQLYMAVSSLPAMVQRAVHLGAILALTFLLHPPYKGAPKDRVSPWLILDILLVAASLAVTFFIVYYLNDIFDRQGDWLPEDFVISGIGILLVLEAARRVIGLGMAVICVISLLYAMFGPYMPDLLAHKGYSLERIATTLWLTTEGVFGLPLGVAASFVYLFVLFGAFLEGSGAGDFFINMAYALTGRFSGGPAKTSVLASGFMGSVSGSAIANVVATGTFTIPLMKKVGYRPQVAGAVEAAASTGGQLMPPIMGAGAFLMAEFTNTSYLHIVAISIVPALMYYLTVLMFVHFEAKKQGIVGQPKEKLPKAGATFKQGLHFVLPVAVLVVVLLNNFSPMMAGFTAVISTWVASLIKRSSRMGLTKILDALDKGARNAVMVSVACAAAGVIIGVISLTGVGLKFSSLVLEFSFGSRLLAIILIGVASLVLGMGLPVTASYIVLVILAGPALEDLGVPLLVAHVIVFWYSQDANVTPPVSLAAFAGAGLAGAKPMQTAFVAWKLAKGLYIIPIIMAYRPLLFNGPLWDTILTMVTTTCGLVAFAACLERYFLREATWLETGLLGLAAAGLFWPQWYGDLIGLVTFIGVIAMQKYYSPPSQRQAAGGGAPA